MHGIVSWQGRALPSHVDGVACKPCAAACITAVRPPPPAPQENDIILCDGMCNRAYHVKCLVPPVNPEELPEDEGWLCPACDRKVS